MQLSEFIRARAESIAANGGVGCPRPHAMCSGEGASLAPYLTAILLAAADDLQRVHGGGSSEARTAAAERLAQVLPLDQVVHVYSQLRGAVLGRWLDDPEAQAAGSVQELVRFGRVLDESLAAAVAHHEHHFREAGEEQARLHARLADSEERFRALVTATSHAVYRLSPDGSAMREMEGRGFVTDTREPNSAWLGEYIHPDDQPMVVEVFRKAMRSRSLFEVEHRYRRVDGRIGWTLSRAVPLVDENGRITEWFGAASDVTARRQAQEALAEADRSKDEFLAVLGHELRNPLAPLRTSVDLLEEVRRNPVLLETLRPMMERQLSHLVRLVDDLLDVSRISRGQVTLQRVALDLNGPIEAALEQTRSAITSRRHDLEVALSEAPLPVRGDSVRLTQVVANLLSNAAKYMAPGGRIRISSGMENGQAVVRVRDTGYGIPPDRFNKLFKLFSRMIDHRMDTGEGGLGIGLALSHQLVALHQGSIEAYSEGSGKGSEFVVRLPCDERATCGTAAADRQEAAAPLRRVLVVEDNVDAAESLRILLQIKGQEVEVVHDGPAALAAMQRFGPQVVLLDLGLPGMHGTEVARRIRAMPGGDRVLLVSLTGWGQDEDRLLTAAAGFDEHITKPIGVEEIDRLLATA